jgi:hypothetical protein
MPWRHKLRGRAGARGVFRRRARSAGTDRRRQFAPDNTNNVLALAFGVLIVVLIIGGSLWIIESPQRPPDADAGNDADAKVMNVIASGAKQSSDNKRCV